MEALAEAAALDFGAKIILLKKSAMLRLST
jgi:hypothetical protein